MPATLPLIIQGGNLPLNFEPTAQEYSVAFLRRLKLMVDGSKVILGSTDPGEPPFNTGPWIPNRTWYAWDDGRAEYLPVAFVASSTNNAYQFNADNLTANRTLTVQDKTGTVALLLDVYVPRTTGITSGTAPTIDWSSSNMFIEKLSGNTTVSFSNVALGQKIAIAFVNAGTGYTVAWPANVQWPAATPPVQPAATAGENATGIYVFRQSSASGASRIYGEFFSSSIPSLTVTPGGTSTVDSNYGLNPDGTPSGSGGRNSVNLP